MSQSESPIDNFEARFHEFEQYDAAFTEPLMKPALEMAATYSELLKTEDITDKQRLEIVRELDTAWGVLMKSPVKITGTIEFLNANGERQSRYLEEFDAISNGFYISNDQPTCIKYHLIVSPRNLGFFDQPENSLITVVGGIEQVVLDPSMVSFERATAYLQALYPELLEEIDNRLFNAEGEEAEELLSLRGLRLPPTIMESAIARISVESYINTLLTFDQQVPYASRIKGTAFLDDKVVHARSDYALVCIKGVSIVSETTIEQYQPIPYLTADMLLLSEDHRHDTVALNVTLGAIRKLASLRRIYFESGKSE